MNNYIRLLSIALFFSVANEHVSASEGDPIEERTSNCINKCSQKTDDFTTFTKCLSIQCDTPKSRKTPTRHTQQLNDIILEGITLPANLTPEAAKVYTEIKSTLLKPFTQCINFCRTRKGYSNRWDNGCEQNCDTRFFQSFLKTKDDFPIMPNLCSSLPEEQQNACTKYTDAHINRIKFPADIANKRFDIQHKKTERMHVLIQQQVRDEASLKMKLRKEKRKFKREQEELAHDKPILAELQKRAQQDGDIEMYVDMQHLVQFATHRIESGKDPFYKNQREQMKNLETEQQKQRTALEERFKQENNELIHDKPVLEEMLKKAQQDGDIEMYVDMQHLVQFAHNQIED